MRKEINKLVRDGIPGLIAEQGNTIAIHNVLGKETRIRTLLAKLDEEIAELKEAYNDFIPVSESEYYDSDCANKVVEEMADVMEVLKGLCYHTPITNMQKQVLAEKDSKASKRGGFEKMWYLEWVDDNKN